MGHTMRLVSTFRMGVEESCRSDQPFNVVAGTGGRSIKFPHSSGPSLDNTPFH